MTEPRIGPVVGRVIGTEDATPLEFWVAVGPGEFLQLDDVVALERLLPAEAPAGSASRAAGSGASPGAAGSGGRRVRIYGVVTQVRARHEGARFDSDVFLIEDGRLPAEVSEAGMVMATRFEPEIFVPPRPGDQVRRAVGADRDQALFFDRMEQRLPAGLSRDGERFYLNLEFLDGTRGAHVNISGVSGVATKTSYATFLLYGLFHSGVLGAQAQNTKALIFNVKGEDLLFLDRPNTALEHDPRELERYRRLGLEPGAFQSVELWAPPKRDSPAAAPDVGSRHDRAITSFFWTIHEFCHEELLRFLFADAEDDRQQYTIVIHNVAARLREEAKKLDDGGAMIEGAEIRTLHELVELIGSRLNAEEGPARTRWAGAAIGQGTVNAFLRRLYSALPHVAHLVRGDVARPERNRIRRERQVTVVDIHNLNDRAKRFVVGVVLRTALEEKERSGAARPSLYVVLDELNKYAPREGSSPIKEILLDVAERGRSLGIILIGAQQTASEVERRIIANSAIRVVGRLDSAESGRDEYGWLPGALRQRATILKPGTMVVSQPELPIPMVLEFPFPAWATRPGEAGPAPAAAGVGADPFAGLVPEAAPSSTQKPR